MADIMEVIPLAGERASSPLGSSYFLLAALYRMIAVVRFIIAVTRLIISSTLSPPFYAFIIPPVEWYCQ
jgi:hypothetical protein|nr:MAG TPA: hypothetical protein [Caudoviricetes sp.]